MLKLRSILTGSRSVRREDGAGDILSLVLFIIIPVMVLTGFVVLSGFFQVRNNIQQQADTGARQVALYGGWDKDLALNSTDQDVQNAVKARIWKNGACTFSRCYQEPVVTCTPKKAVDLSAVAKCTITYYYLPYANDGLGLANATYQPFTVTSERPVETYYRGNNN